MRFNVHRIIEETEFSQFSQKLSDKGKSSASCRIVHYYYQIAYNSYRQIDQTLRSYREQNGKAVQGNIGDIKPISQRLETELISFVTVLMVNLPSLESIINDDPQLDEPDRKILIESYQSFKQKIANMFKLLDHPSFAIKI
jgi:hypothetical protein